MNTKIQSAFLTTIVTVLISIATPSKGIADSLYAFPQSVTVSGSASGSSTEGSVSYSFSMTGTNMQSGSNANGATISGFASGTYSVTITTNDHLGDCTDTGSIDNDFVVQFGGVDPWVGYFNVSQLTSSDEYPCLLGPLDVLSAIHALVLACGGSTPAGRSIDEADDPQLSIDQEESGSCGSIEEHALIYNEFQDDDEAPIEDGAEIESASVQKNVSYDSLTQHRLHTSVTTNSGGDVQITVRNKNTLLGTTTQTVDDSGTFDIEVQLKAKKIKALFKSKDKIPLTVTFAGANEGVTKKAKLGR